MTFEKIEQSFTKLANIINYTVLNSQFDEKSADYITEIDELQHIINTNHQSNAWFIPQFITESIKSIFENLDKTNFNNLSDIYKNLLTENKSPKKVKIIMAGNIPLVGFHDLFCVLLTGNIAIIKFSSKDDILIKQIIKILIKIDNNLNDFIIIEDSKRIEFDAIIATGSDNTSRYFDYYFGKYPNIIRKNRNSVAILTGNETSIDLSALSKDIFLYFGLGCRNISKIYVPLDYNFDAFFNSLFDYNWVINHAKYANNYDYNKAIYLLGNQNILDNGFILLKEDTGFSSPVSVIYFEYYSDFNLLTENLKANSKKLQCIVSKTKIQGLNTISPGKTQYPSITEFADNVDTIKFLSEL